MNRKLRDLLVVILFMIGGVWYATLMRDTIFGKAAVVGFMYFIPASIYLGIVKKKFWKKILVATVLFGGIFGFIFEFVQEYTGMYTVLSSLFPFKIFGVLPVDNVVGHLEMTFFTFVFYEHFLSHERSSHVSKHLIFALIPGIVVMLSIILLYYISPSLLKIPYSYLLFGLTAIIPTFFLAITQPKYIKNMAEIAAFFFFVYFVFEVIALSFGYWTFAGDSYIGWVQFLNLQFPFEELVFWMLFYAATLVAYYELFIDQQPKIKKRR